MPRQKPIDTSNVPEIMSELGKCFDELAEAQKEHGEVSARVKRRKQFVKTWEAALAKTIKAGSAAADQQGALAAIHVAPEYAEYLADIEELEILDRAFDYLTERRGICQSLLKQHQADANEVRFGKGAPQRDTIGD
jgi:hypothetical protein